MESYHEFATGSPNGLCRLCGRDVLHEIHICSGGGGNSDSSNSGGTVTFKAEGSGVGGNENTITGRKRLEQRRPSISFDFEHHWETGQTFRYRATVSYYKDGSLGELFLNSSKRLGTILDANARDAAIYVSIALQYGAPLEVLRNAQARNSAGYPTSPVGMALDEICRRGFTNYFEAPKTDGEDDPSKPQPPHTSEK